MISYKNLGDQDVLLFANSVHKSINEPYDSIGLTLTFQNQMTPIGAFGEGSFVIVRPNSTKRLLYTYSPIYNNIWFLGGSNPFTKKEDVEIIFANTASILVMTAIVIAVIILIENLK